VNLLDYALLALIALSAIAAAMRGFLYEVWMMAAALAALALAAWQYASITTYFDWLPNQQAQNIAAFAAIVIVILVAAAIVGRMARGAVRAAGLGGLDRVLGACLGLLRGVVLAAALVAVLVAWPLRPDLVRNSRLASSFVWCGGALVRVLPGDLSVRFDQGVASLRSSLP